MSAASRGIHIVCEKPLAPSLADAQEMADCASRNDVRTIVCQSYRWQPWLLGVKRVIDDGQIGTPFYANITQRIPFAVPSGPDGKIGIVEDQPFYLKIKNLLMLEMVTHYVDALRFIFGEPSSVFAKSHRISKHIVGEDLAVLVLSFPSLLGVIEDSWASVGQDVTNRIFVEGDQGVVRFGGTQGPPHAPTTTVPPLEIISRDGAVKTEELDMTRFYTRSFELLQRHLVDCMRSGQEPMTSVQDNVKTLKVVFGAYESSKEGKPVAL
jgi:predicted dehydrogenase